MAGASLASDFVHSAAQPLWTLQGRPFAAMNAVATACCYVVLYITLDWVSFVQALPGSDYTPWNLPPALSLAFLTRKGLWFAPVVFCADLISDRLVAHFPQGLLASVGSSAVVAAGYTATAALLRLAPVTGHRRIGVGAVIGFLGIAAGGAFLVALADVNVAIAFGEMPSGLARSAIWNSFIGDLTGILGLLPALLTWTKAWERWKEVKPNVRAIDLGIFMIGLVAPLLLVFDEAWVKELQLFYLMFPPVIWIAVRHGLAWSAIAILIDQLALVASIAVLGFSSYEFLSLQLLFLVISATCLILGAVVTERDYAEEILRHKQAEIARYARLTTVGAFGAAVVHEIGQPLAAAAAFVHVSKWLLADTPINDELLRETLGSVEQETLRARTIIERIRNFLDRGDLRWCSINLGEVLHQVAAALADEARAHGVAIRVNGLASTLIDADRTQMEQVLVNLMRNAIEAAADRERGGGSVQASLFRSSRSVRIEVEDNGPGVAPDIVERLFAPFETTKRRGMGLGLSLSREIVNVHGGRLWLDRTDATGSRFVLELPDKSEVLS